MRLHRLVATALTLGGAVLVSGLPGTAYAASTDGPDFEMPFACGASWTGTSRDLPAATDSGHGTGRHGHPDPDGCRSALTRRVTSASVAVAT